MHSPSDVAVTGLGVVSAVGNGISAFWERIVAGNTAITIADDLPVAVRSPMFLARVDGVLGVSVPDLLT